MIYRVDVSLRPGFPDARGAALLRQAETLGVKGLQALAVADLYFLAGDLDEDALRQLATELLHDPVVEQAQWRPLSAAMEPAASGDAWSVEVTLLPGVTDSVAESLLAGAAMVGVQGLRRAAAGHRYTLMGDLSEADVHRVARGLLANEVIQRYWVNRPASPPFLDDQGGRPTAGGEASWVEVIPLCEADDAGLLAISQARRLALDLAEMRAIQAYFRAAGREPTDVELEMLAQTWSEHCVHKTFKAVIEYVGPPAGPLAATSGEPIPATTQRIDGLLKTYIRAATEKVAKPWVRSAFVDNAGIVAFDEHFDVAFKVETHNHPSALEPFGGANTGVGGVVRDIIGVSARPIANTDILFFGPRDLPWEQLPAGVLHPQRIADGVVAGIEDYGNKMGIPTVNGAIFTDPGYTANPLVFCGCVGILPHGAHRTEPQVGDLAVVIGGRTGRDGLRGATFSSMEMDHQTGEVAGSAVQIGHPIHEKQVLEAVLRARDEGLYNAITDCGAGGLSSAIGEMAKALGAVVHLEAAPLKYAGLRPWEIWLSEAQERMVLAVPPEKWPRFQALCASLDVEATALGEFTGDGRLRIFYGERPVGDVDVDFLHNGIPRRQLRAEWSGPEQLTVNGERLTVNLTEVLLALLAMPETRSKEHVVRQYDHEVQGGTVVKPFVGAGNAGPGDAAVLVPLDALRQRAHANLPISQSTRGLALSVGANPFYTALDPYCMAWAAVDEAVRNAVAVGADPDRISLLDNFSWGNPNLPDRLGSLVRCVQGCYDAAVAYAAPFISGKDSLNNEYTGADGQRHAIPGTLVISALGIVPDVSRTVTMDLKRAGDWLYIVGWTRGELGGSSLLRRFGDPLAGLPPQPPADALDLYRRLHQAMRQGLVQACHDCSEGGLAVAAAEMALAGGLGLELRLADVPRTAEADSDAAVAFCESLGRLLVAVRPSASDAFEALMAGHPVARIGRVRSDDRIVITGLDGQPVIDVTLEAVRKAWRSEA